MFVGRPNDYKESTNKNYLQLKAAHSHKYEYLVNTMTVIYKLDLDILEMYLHIKNEVSRSRLSKVTA